MTYMYMQYTCIDTTFKVLSVLLPVLQGTKGYCCVTANMLDQLVPNGYKVATGLLQLCYQVKNVPIPGFRQPCCKDWLLQCYNNEILQGCRFVTRLSEACS